MPTDYAAVRKANIARYGYDSEYHSLISDSLYPDQTHFIFELLQNADDAQASWVDFRVFKDRLELRHDGQPFTKEDVQSICSIGSSTKKSDLTKIGKFGIGFKSVYGFTNSPAIHSRDEHFEIRKYIRPHRVSPIEVEKNETLFVFPFNAEQKLSATEALEVIGDGLRDLDPRALLFLRNVASICWATTNGVRGTFERMRKRTRVQGAERIVVSRGPEKSEEWLTFKRCLRTGRLAGLHAAIAFRLEQRPGRVARIDRLRQSPLVAYFATQKETHLGFLVQGPYRTTPARDNVPSHDKTNRQLTAEIAKLIKPALLAMRERGMIDAATLRTFPVKEELFPERSLFRPFFDETVAALVHQELLPVQALDRAKTIDTYVRAGNAVVSTDEDLCRLIGHKRLRALFGASKKLRVISFDVGADADLRSFLEDHLGIEGLTGARFAQKVATAFLEAQSDRWIIDFYSYLNGRKELWRRRKPWEGAAPSLRDKEIIRLETKEHVAPFARSDEPSAFLPLSSGSAAEATFSTVREVIAKDRGALSFLRAIGLKAPNLADVVRTRVLVKYTKGGPLGIDRGEHLRDWAEIASVYDGATRREREALLTWLRKVRCLRCVNASSGGVSYLRPAKGFLGGSVSELFLRNAEGYRKADDCYSKEVLALLQSAGLQSTVSVSPRRPRGDGHVYVESCHSNHRRGLDGFDAAFSIRRLEEALSEPTIELALFLWNTVCVTHWRHIRGRVESSSQRDFGRNGRHYSCYETLSPAGRLLCRAAWLPNHAGKFVSPSQLSLDDLGDAFRRSEAASEALGMKVASSTANAERAKERMEAVKILGLGTKALAGLEAAVRAGVSEEEALRALEQLTRAKRAAERASAESKEGDGASFREGFEERFAQPGAEGTGDRVTPAGLVGNPRHRRRRVGGEIRGEWDSEPDAQERYRHSFRKVWEAKDPQTRTFLLEQYDGECQVCGCSNAFLMRNGVPYFEALYVVPASTARWMERPGNCLCLCAVCSAKLSFGSIDGGVALQEGIRAFRLSREGGEQRPGFEIELCGARVFVGYTEKHFLDLQEMLKAEAELGSEVTETSS